MWDFFGGHVTFEVGVMASATALEDAYRQTALREAREEMPTALHGFPHLIRERDLVRIGTTGQFKSGFGDPRSENLEYSSVYVLCIPKDATVLTPFEKRDGSVEWLVIEEVPWSDIAAFHGEWTTLGAKAQLPDSLARLARGGVFPGFADGADRVLRAANSDTVVAGALGVALEWCSRRRMTVRVLGVVLDGDGRIVMVYKGPSRHNPEPCRYDLPGGGIKAGETPISALRRELCEECSLAENQYTDPDIFGVVDSHFDDFPDDGRVYDSMNVIYECSCQSGAAVEIAEQGGDQEGVGWHNPSTMREDQCSIRAWYALQCLAARQLGCEP